jgi:hypothetical protein
MSLIRSHRLGIASLVAGMTFAAGCSDPTSPSAPAVASLEATGPADTLGLTDTVRVSVIGRDAAGAAMTGLVIAFRTLHPLVARVDDTGLVTGIAAGNASIVATVDGRADVADTVVVRVRPLPRTLAIAGLADSLAAVYEPTWQGSARDTATATVRDARGTTLTVPVRWSSSDTSVATVGTSGIVTARAPDVAWIRADAGRGAVDSVLVRGFARRVTGPAFAEFHIAQWGAGAAQLGNLSCGLATTGEAWCGSGAALVTQAVPGGHRFRALTVGDRSACGLLVADSTLACWGNNNAAQLGLGTTMPASVTTPVIAAGGRKFRSADMGWSNTVCAVGAADSLVYCWGNNAVGATGDAPVGGIDSTIAPVPGLPKALAVAVASSHACAVVVDGSVWCWGDAAYFANISGSVAARARAAAQLVAANSYTAIAANEYGACMLDAAGVVRCLMGSRQSGVPGTILRTLPGASMARLVGGRGSTACGISPAASATCWNLSFSNDANTTLMAMTRMRGRTVIDVASSTFTLCATTDDHIVQCW